MSTPNPSAPTGPPTSQHKHHASTSLSHIAASTPTPSAHPHLAAFTSPAPRSVPSPAAQRAGKSPFAIASTHAATNHPTGGSTSSARLAGSSPAPGMLGFESPAAMGLSLSGMGLGGEGMGMGLSGLGLGMTGSGLSGMGAGRGVDDEERRRRLESVIRIVGSRVGRVSGEGVERLCKRLGLDVAWDDSRVKKDGVMVMMVAGQTVVIDIDFKANEVVKLALSFPGANASVTEHIEPAARILQDDLTPASSYAKINHTLDKFARNLERLARMDKLSSTQVNCFEAIAGVHSSLERLFEHEKQAALLLIDATKSNKEERAEREVLCKRSGRPRMHADHTIGVSIEYWMEKRSIFPPRKNQDAMDIDQKPGKKSKSAGPEKRVFSLSIECEQSPPALYPPMRISNAWLDDNPVTSPKPDDLFTLPVINWLDPPQTFLPNTANSAQPDVMAMDALGLTAGKLPNVRFIARLMPPLVVPLSVVGRIYTAVGATLSTDSLRISTYDGLLLDRGKAESEGNLISNGALLSPKFKDHSRKATRHVPVPSGNGTFDEAEHLNTLFNFKHEYAVTLEEIPFVHPRQIVELIPILRQYAQLSSLVTVAMTPNSSSVKPSESVAPKTQDSLAHLPESLRKLLGNAKQAQGNGTRTSIRGHPTKPGVTIDADSDSDFSDGMLTPPSPDVPTPRPLNVDISLSMQMQTQLFPTTAEDMQLQQPVITLTPRLTTVFPVPLKDGSTGTLNTTIKVLQNGDLQLTDWELSGDEASKSRPVSESSKEPQPSGSKDVEMEDAQDTTEPTPEDDKILSQRAKVLDVCEDLNIWVEWVRKKATEGAGD